MRLSWPNLSGLIDPRTFLGALVLALVMIVLASVACLVTNKLIKRSSWVTARLKRKVDVTVVLAGLDNPMLFIVPRRTRMLRYT